MEKYDKEIKLMQENLKQLREIAKWSVQDFADILGVTRQTINNLETKKTEMTKLQYLAIRSCFDYEANNNETLRDLLNLLVYNPDKYKKDEYKEIQKQAKLLSSTAKGGASKKEIGEMWQIIIKSIPTMASAVLVTLATPLIANYSAKEIVDSVSKKNK